MLMSEYREKAKRFAVYKDEDYPFWAQFEEAGELVSLFAKAMRGDYHEPSLPDVTKECGDWLWQLALCKQDDWSDFDFDEAEAGAVSPLAPLQSIAEHSAIFIQDRDEDVWRQCCVCLLMFVNAYGHGLTIERVAETNLAKLESRKQRGKIQGNGDNR